MDSIKSRRTFCDLTVILSCWMLVGCNLTGPAETPDEADTEMIFVNVPAGKFRAGMYAREDSLDHAFEIAKYEVTNVQYTLFLEQAYARGEISVEDTVVTGYYAGDEHWPAGDRIFKIVNTPQSGIHFANGKFHADERLANHPVALVTWYGAEAFAGFYGFRLPQENEWEKAARGNSTRDYPWGNTISGQRANYFDSGDPFDNGSSPVGYYNGDEHDGFQTLDGASPFGAYDMAGNVWEWLGEFAGTSSYRIIKSGSWAGAGGRLRCWDKSLHFPDEKYTSFGFRVVRIP